jgi:hypothetical protein
MDITKKGDMMGISTLQDAIKLSGVIDLVPHLRTTVFAPIFIPVAVRKYQEQKFIDRNRTPAVGAVEFGGIQILEMIRALSGSTGRRMCKVIRAVFHRENLGFDIEVMILL